MIKSNRIRLNEIMREHDLNATQVAALIGTSAVMVRQYRCGLYRMPDHRLELLELKLPARLQGRAV